MKTLSRYIKLTGLEAISNIVLTRKGSALFYAYLTNIINYLYYGVISMKKDVKLITITKKHPGNSKQDTLFNITYFEYQQSTYSCQKKYDVVGRSELINAIRAGAVILLNGKLSRDSRLLWNVPSGSKERLELVLNGVRSLMEAKYGKGTDLCGRCIEASELIVANLKYWGCNDCKTVEGWCEFDDDSNCSDAPYDPHTWVEMGNIYIDVTADQFNYNMYKENEYPPILIHKGLPHGMCYEEPEGWEPEEGWDE